MNKLIHRVILLSAMTVSVSLATMPSLQAEVGFQPVLDFRSNEVSQFLKPLDRFSVAMFPYSRAPLTPQLRYTPTLQYSSFEHNHLVFNTTYHRTEEMIPIAVDAPSYPESRLQAYMKDQRENRALQQIKDARKEGRREGLSIGVNLPKRFDRIFGEGGGNLRVSGRRKISFSGRSQWTDGARSDIATQSKFPSLNMEQVSEFTINGTIGTKISVSVTQNSQQDIPLANRIQIRYKGDEDDVLKSIEAGNTNLQLPNTRFVGYSSRIQGLFGLKAEAQLGNLRLIGIASQEKGSSERASISASGEESARTIRDYQYIEGRVFDLGSEDDFGPNDIVQTLFVYEEPRGDSSQFDSALLRIDPNSVSNYDVTMKVTAVEQDKYETRHDAETNTHIIIFSTQKREAIGIYMVVDRYDDTGYVRTDTIGDISQTPYVLKILQSDQYHREPENPSWDLMWRNCYRLPRGIRPEDVDIKVFKGLAGREGTNSSLDYQQNSNGTQTPYLTLLGLDLESRQGLAVPDGIVDDIQLQWEPDLGLLIFPDRKPFATNTTYSTSAGATPPLTDKAPDLYDFVSNQERAEASKYYIQIATQSRSSTIRLNRANIIEGSERITIDGVPLVRDEDYRIQYDFGQVTLLSEKALDPNGDLNIEFEYAPFLAIQKKTLLGLRAEYEWSNDLKFGSTVLYKSDKAQDRKPRVGQETARALILDFDGTVRLHPNFLSKAVDALPFVTTDAKSSVTISGEIAQSRPNPNVEGQAYLDDFEASQDQMSLGTNRTGWVMGSRPTVDSTELLPSIRRKMIWHNMPAISWERVYKSEKAPGQGVIRPLRLALLSSSVETKWDSTQNQLDTVGQARSWGSVMRSFGNRIDADRVQLLEVRLKGDQGVLHFDFGKISTDIDLDEKLDTEDTDDNNAVDSLEDFGLDGFFDPDEVSPSGQPYHSTDNPDPSGDDWWFNGEWPPPVGAWRLTQAFRDSVLDENNIMHYAWINGTEGNRNDQLALGIPDEEINARGSWEEKNAYFSFSIDLSSTDYMVEDSENEEGWRTYRIPIKDSLALDSLITTPPATEDQDTLTPKWSQISHVRVWMEADENTSTPYEVQIATWHFVQANWQDTLVTQTPEDTTTTFFVASVSDEENVNFTPPPGVEAYRDKTTDIVEAQRALALVFDELKPGDTGLAVKELIGVEQYSGYRRLQMYVHGPGTATTDTVLFFFRIGRDAENFYEYNARLVPGWNETNYVNMDFNEITALKDAYLRAAGNPRALVDTTSGPYRVYGAPNLNEIKYFTAGIVNANDTVDGNPITGEVWLDELRVTDVRKDVGTAVRLDVNGNMADLLTYNFSIDHRDPYFRGLSKPTRGGSNQNLGSGSTSKNFRIGATLQFHKFLPRTWNARLPISVSYSKSVSIPLLRTNSDVVLPEEVRDSEKSTSESKRFSVSEAFNRKGKNPLFSLLLNRQKVSFSYTRSEKTSVTKPFTFAENYNIKADYDMSMKSGPGVKVFFWTKYVPILKKASASNMYFLPDSWRWSGTFNRSLSVTEDPDHTRRPSYRRDLTGRMDMSYKVFDNLTMSYNFTTKRDLSDPDLVRLSLSDPKIGLETNYTQSYRTNYDPRLLTWLTGAFGYSAGYSDTWDRSSSSRNSSMNRSWSVGGAFKHLDLLGGKSSPLGRVTARGNVRGGQGAREEVKDKPFYDPPLAILRLLTGWINPISYKYARTFKNSAPALLQRPSMLYRLGLRDQTDVPRSANSRSPSSAESVSYDFGSGFSALGGITTTVKYKRSINRDLVKRGGASRLEKITTGWPDLSIRISKFSYFPFIKDYVNGFIKVFSPRTGYNRQVKEDRNLDAGFVTRRDETINRNPLLGINFKVLRAMSMSAQYSVAKTNSERFNQASGDLMNKTRSTRKTVAITAKYSFSAPGGISIPLFGKLKFTSQANIDVNIKFTSDRSENAKPGGAYVISTDKSEFSVSPRISYQFSRQIRGGLSGQWQDINDAKQGQKRHVRQLQAWVEIQF
ncbi:MAG: cell surface protein SprA [Candidatus Zixiibacteriota bacterium]|nr:MAG: cell surface protein SprA [candidate division Zixibacteria bacterium]